MKEPENRPNSLEGVLIGQIMSSVYIPLTVIYGLVNESFINTLKTIPEEYRWIVPASLYILIGIPGLVIEAKTYIKKGYISNTWGNGVYGATESLPLAMLAGQAYGWLSNPTNIFMIKKLLEGGKDPVITAHLSSIFSLGIVYSAINLAVLNDKTEFLMKGAIFVREKVEKPVDKWLIQNSPVYIWVNEVDNFKEGAKRWLHPLSR